MQTIIHANAILDVNNVFMNCCVKLLGAQRLFRCDLGDRQQSVNDLHSNTFGKLSAGFSYHSKANVSVGVKAKKGNYMLVATS